MKMIDKALDFIYGFTLVEWMIVVAIVGLLAAFIVPTVIKSNREEATKGKTITKDVEIGSTVTTAEIDYYISIKEISFKGHKYIITSHKYKGLGSTIHSIDCEHSKCNDF